MQYSLEFSLGLNVENHYDDLLGGVDGHYGRVGGGDVEHLLMLQVPALLARAELGNNNTLL